MKRLPDAVDGAGGDIEMAGKAIEENGDKETTSPKNSKLDKKKSMANAHKKTIGEHGGAYGMHSHGVWSIEELQEGAQGVTRGKTGVVTRCADHVNRYIIEFDEKVNALFFLFSFFQTEFCIYLHSLKE